MFYCNKYNFLLLSCVLLWHKAKQVNANIESPLMRHLLQLGQYQNRCSIAEKGWMTQCQIDAQNDWNAQYEQDYTSRKYCCYQWDTLRCQLKIARKCDLTYANYLESTTEQKFNSLCYYHSRHSASCALRWWSIMLIVIGGLLIIAAVAFAIFRYRQNKYRRRYDY